MYIHVHLCLKSLYKKQSTLCNLYAYTYLETIQVALLGQAESSSIWLPAEKIPSTLIQEYRNDVTLAVEDGVTLHSGQLLHTLRSTTNSSCTKDKNSFVLESSDG